MCYCLQLCVAATMVSVSAIGNYLMNKMHPEWDRPRDWKEYQRFRHKELGLGKLIKKPVEDGLISEELAERIDRLRKTVRNPLVHPESRFVRLAMLGLTQVGPSTWGGTGRTRE